MGVLSIWVNLTIANYFGTCYFVWLLTCLGCVVFS